MTAPRPHIRFCTASDGLSLAVGTSGNGPPVVRAGTWLTHLEQEATSPLAAPWSQELSRRHRYVVYDGRGCGLSDRRVEQLSLDRLVADLEAVVDGLELPRFALLGLSMGAAVAVAYAARHPERVSRLVLHGGYLRSYLSTRDPPPRVREEAELLFQSARLGWGTGSAPLRAVFSAKLMGAATDAQRRAFDELQRLTSSAQVAELYLRTMFAFDVSALAPKVACPTLAFHARGDQLVFFEQGRQLASRIPGARLVPLESANHLPFREEPAWTALVAALRPFLDQPAEAGAPLALTPRQLEVLRAVARGLTDKEIASQLSLSPRTVEMHVARALKALDCARRAEAVRRAAEAGLLD